MNQATLVQDTFGRATLDRQDDYDTNTLSTLLTVYMCDIITLVFLMSIYYDNIDNAH